ncbi:MAG: hypothetical protein ACW98K_13915, partial [Candidatus Kariarchaeaceae archaeon]
MNGPRELVGSLPIDRVQISYSVRHKTMKTLGTKRESFSDLNSASQFLAKAIQESPQSVVHVMLGNVKAFFTDGSELYISVPMERSLLQAPVPKGQLIDLLIFNRFIEKSAHNLKTG